ncbi:similar to Saccharomyces cerevisiae YBR152W SPP381 mRNA splicing factor, component of U4/U6.U5 tri-snRNP [Maudiozyma barnettii]|uniref:Similar to Saccharomyces cerevisiae YBR152W SPP381 mRNA splicing factor, component of U4/U6.U5 tri-snRNP n=1 Tax=Maudiozyma barnettii TaxID=61262 RepID=A0A8H2VDU2_9SACH|nr:U4/U6-U5 snRNP complex subunit SPP381 [Kazachstania barnettii]CAB4253618.1 similar to Saccharomyces cerevisiae YBR152W SPP381 mRNA splicing factor, component of U4/U6.U5 tri-snRNP [Kazachstania barnettii]CAD1781294.1 similar to Saccharomyces cerevisiae YBR152W SPP381 mRNA splicing factor, component of U4/U6.U5 tri-snRNP [Kazachstania barnettii]
MSNSEDVSSNDYNSSDDLDSSSDEEIVLHKPIFLKRKGKDIKLDDSRKDSKLVKVQKLDNSQDQLMNRIHFENDQANKRDELNSQITNDYTTDKDILRRTMLLNDDDTIDPEYERQEWLKREKMRENRHRDKLVKKQLEFENKEANKLKSNEKGNKDLESQSTDLNITKSDLLSKTVKKSDLDLSKKYKPQVARDQNFGTSNGLNEDSKTENEYSIL